MMVVMKIVIMITNNKKKRRRRRSRRRKEEGTPNIRTGLRDSIVLGVDFQKVRPDFIISFQSLILIISESVHSRLVRCSKQAADAVYREV